MSTPPPRGFLTEDEVRDLARDAMGLRSTALAEAGVGQLTTFNQLGFPGISYKPDGWYLPHDHGGTAVVLEAKSSRTGLRAAHLDELRRNTEVVAGRYAHAVGVLTNGERTQVIVDGEPSEVPDELQSLDFYLSLVPSPSIDKSRIYDLTRRINDSLHGDFGVADLYHRMTFTACALVAERYGARLGELKGRGWEIFHTAIHSTLSKSLEADRRQNGKIDILLEEYAGIRMNTTGSQGAIDGFIDCVTEISECINSNEWRGEDVMGIFFNEFNRYKGKSSAGQVFTPEHITDFMYKILEVGPDDCVLDAACGSGGFLVKAMANMIRAAGGAQTKKAASIKRSQLYGIELYRDVYALACANMLIHKDGKSNLVCLDSRTGEAGAWIRSKPITKVLMNPPFETKFGCMDIVENVLDNVQGHTMCAFILPDKKLEKAKGAARRIRERHRLLKVIKLPEDLFPGTGATTSIFVFEAGVPQDGREFFACHMADDGLETVKNKGRHDVRGLWPAIEARWVDIVAKQSGDGTCQWVDPAKHLSYQAPPEPFAVAEEDFRKAAMDYLMYRRGIDAGDFGASLLDAVLYSGDVRKQDGSVVVAIEGR